MYMSRVDFLEKVISMKFTQIHFKNRLSLHSCAEEYALGQKKKSRSDFDRGICICMFGLSTWIAGWYESSLFLLTQYVYEQMLSYSFYFSGFLHVI